LEAAGAFKASSARSTDRSRDNNENKYSRFELTPLDIVPFARGTSSPEELMVRMVESKYSQHGLGLVCFGEVVKGS